MSNTTKQWYALFTKSGYEKKVANVLSRKNIENYCPLKHQTGNRRRGALEPLFSSFVFIFVSESDMIPVRRIEGVMNFLHWLGKPAQISSDEIEIMRRFMSEYSDVKLEKLIYNLDTADKLRLNHSPDNKIHLVSVKNNTIKIVLPSLGYSMVAEVASVNVESIAPARQSYNLVEKYKYAI